MKKNNLNELDKKIIGAIAEAVEEFLEEKEEESVENEPLKATIGDILRMKKDG